MNVQTQPDRRVDGQSVTDQYPDASGHFGVYGGSFIAEILMDPVLELVSDMHRAMDARSAVAASA